MSVWGPYGDQLHSYSHWTQRSAVAHLPAGNQDSPYRLATGHLNLCNPSLRLFPGTLDCVELIVKLTIVGIIRRSGIKN